MKKIIFAAAFAAMLGINAFAHQAFTLVSSEKKTVKEADLAALEKGQTMGKKDKTTLTFTETDVRLVVVTGPEDDMLSYRIQGVRNPTLIVPSGATLRVLFVNVDDDMKHDIRFGHVMGAFMANPSIAETAGANKLPSAADGVVQAEDIVIKASIDGAYKYFCSVGSHAKDGMWGNILVGVKAGKNMEMPKQTKHVHAPDEDKEGHLHEHGEMGDMPGMEKGAPTPSPTPHQHGDMGNMPGMEHGNMPGMNMEMHSVTNVGDPMEREASGTSWNPDASPMYAKMKMYDDGGMLMFMGNMFVRYTSIGSTRNAAVAGKGSRSRADAPSMFMLMYSRPIGENSQIGFRGMMSLDPVIERGYGYPLLYQSGEEFRGLPIHDRQHPHDLFSELAVTFSHKFNDKRSLYFYAGYPGEPALGPPMYLHRVSGMNNPDAPIGHHWQDSTHITFGVVTAGYSFGKWKMEASAFNGREPDSNRWNFDKPRLDSFSGRFSFNPTKNWAFQVSHAYIKSPERSEPELRILRRTTASAIYNRKIDDDHNWANTFVWGQNYGNGRRSNAFLFEANYDFFKNAVFGRAESVQKSGHELVLGAGDLEKTFRVAAYSLGYIRELTKGKGIDIGLGASATLNRNPNSLAAYYGGTTHGGWQMFFRIRPSKAQ